jgi:hypothetical protein
MISVKLICSIFLLAQLGGGGVKMSLLRFIPKTGYRVLSFPLNCILATEFMLTAFRFRGL